MAVPPHGSSMTSNPYPADVQYVSLPEREILIVGTAHVSQESTELVRQVIRPALADGMTVVCGRYSDSTFAYQGFGAGVSLDTLRVLDAAATDGLRPDLTILLDLPVEAGLARKGPDDTTRFEAEHDVDFHRRVRAGFLTLAGEEPHRFEVVDATRSVDEVAEDVRALVEAVLTGTASEPEAPGARITR